MSGGNSSRLGDGGKPIEPAEMAAWMAPLGPFEAGPQLAIACSGGADSLALTILLDGWARSRNGRVVALIVDHRLRPDSAAEARTVAGWLAKHGIACRILAHEGSPPAGNLQNAARAMRYRLLVDWCAAAQVLHLALAHHREDQAETLLLRLARGSGVDGLAAMAPVVELPELRLLRPLLDVPRGRLKATLDRLGQPFVEDPSNLNPAFSRVRLRVLSPTLAAEGLDTGRLAATARRMGRARAALEEATIALLARTARVHREGYLHIDRSALLAAPEEIGLRALARALTCIGGGRYPPRLERLERLYASLAEGRAGARTLAGCRILAGSRASGPNLLICREAAAAHEATPAFGEIIWDGRFRVRIEGRSEGAVIRRLGREGWAVAVSARPELRRSPIPAAVRPALPALWTLDGLASVPHLNYVHKGVVGVARIAEIVFAPSRPLGAARFIIA